VVDPARLTEACLHLRDVEGFGLLSDITAVDYLGWGSRGVAGYFGTASGRDLNRPGGFGAATGSQGYSRVPQPKAKRFAVNYHLLALREGAPRLRVQVWLDDGETVASVVPVWPTADWHEREAWDMLGIRFDGHPNPTRILMEDDWEGHPLRKDYPIGGEPVRFSDEV
jgi:NADH:ubiquinone oxidoreductase subunit C